MALPGLIYLTPSAAWSELFDSIKHAPDHLTAESSLFLLQWQDILEVANQVFPHADEPQRTMLCKIAAFLEHRGLEYFRGFTHLPIADDTAIDAHFYSPTKVEFSGFTEMPLETISLVEVVFYTSKRKGTFQGFSIEPFEQVTVMDTVFYGGKQ